MAARRLRTAALLVATGAAALPVTLLASPLFGWFEARTGIESLGHSGPAGGCFLATAIACALALPGARRLLGRTR